jgi:uncharacterized protein (TIGR00730 family)
MLKDMNKKICVFCGSRFGETPEWAHLAKKLGEELANKEWALVFGGGNTGLMGAVAQGALQANGKVIGIMPEGLTKEEGIQQNLTEFHLVESMRERKDMMAKISDAFVTIPGGIGTLEEFFELWTAKYVGYHDKPIILANWGGYFDSFLEFISASHKDGFITQAHLNRIVVVHTLEEIVEALEESLCM